MKHCLIEVNGDCQARYQLERPSASINYRDQKRAHGVVKGGVVDPTVWLPIKTYALKVNRQLYGSTTDLRGNTRVRMPIPSSVIS